MGLNSWMGYWKARLGSHFLQSWKAPGVNVPGTAEPGFFLLQLGVTLRHWYPPQTHTLTRPERSPPAIGQIAEMIEVVGGFNPFVKLDPFPM